MDVPTGTAIGPYEVTGTLGAGGMGEVYAVRDSRLDRRAALKILPAVWAHDSDHLARFEREARATAALNHPNIVAVYDVGLLGDRPYIVTELLEGETLRAVGDRGPVPVTRAVAIGAAIADGLAAAHDRGIVHRDLKPENVFVTRDGRVKILDFGIAKLREARADAMTATSTPTMPGTVIGTAAYMAPEQARGLAVDDRADLFSLGAVLYELVSGRRAFEGPTTADVLTAVIAKEPPSFAELGVAAPAPLELLLRRCLEKDPTARFRSAHDLSIALQTVPWHIGAIPPVRRAARIRRWLWAAGGVVLGAGLTMVLLPRASLVYDRTIRFAIPLGALPWSPTGVALFAMSRDGQTLAYLRPERNSGIYVRRLDEDHDRLLPGTEGGAHSLFFSPDGAWVGYQSARTIRRVPISGGAPVEICAANEVRGISWGDNGQVIFATIEDGLWTVPAVGGQPVSLIKPPEGRRFFWPHVLPGSAAILFTDVPGVPGFEGGTVSAYTPADRQLHRLLERAADAEYADGRLYFGRGTALWSVAFDARRLTAGSDVTPVTSDVARWPGNGGTQFAVAPGVIAYTSFAKEDRTQVVQVDPSGQIVRAITNEGYYDMPRLSPDGSLLALASDNTLVVVDLARGGTTKLAIPEGIAALPVWSRDGRTILFTGGAGVPSLWATAADGSGVASRVTTGSMWQYMFDTLADGSLIYAEDNGTTRLDLWIKPQTGAPRVFERTDAWDTSARVSPDGRWVAYETRGPVSSEVWLRSATPPDRRIKVSTDLGSQPVWSRDGSWLFFFHAGDLMRVKYDGSAPDFKPGLPQRIFTGEFRHQSTQGADYDAAPDGGFVMLKPVPPPVVPAAIQMIVK